MSVTSDSLQGKICLVTGASSGIGAAIARSLAGVGAHVICAARRLDRLQELERELTPNCLAIELDVSDSASVETLPSRLPEAWREVDVLVNNAGQDVGGRRLFHEGEVAEWSSIIETNVTGLISVTRTFIEGMRDRRAGYVVNIGSVSGFQPYATGTIYAASKHAVHGFSESLRLDYGGTGIRVTEILPGLVRTGFAEARLSDPVKARAFYDDFGTCLEPADIARTVLFVLEQPAHVVISQLVVVPDGQT
jgi:3-hydroxy acid dehydrogenase/malonic semialdehyde reductase